MIVEAFLQWMETAKTKDRVRAASALGRACIQTSMPTKERVAAEMAMVYLLDDPSPQVLLRVLEARNRRYKRETRVEVAVEEAANDPRSPEELAEAMVDQLALLARASPALAAGLAEKLAAIAAREAN